MYTSGTSGLPKGVVLTYSNLQSDVQAAIQHARLEGGHRFLGIIPLFHSTGLLATMVAPITLGSLTVYIGRFSPVATMKAIREHRISVVAAVPSMYGALARLKDAGPADVTSLYAAISGGEPLPGNVREGFLAKFRKPIYEGYGLTETIGPVAFNTPQVHKPGSVGTPIPGVTIRISDDDGNALPNGQSGEIWLKGPMIMKGYFNLPNETAQSLTADGFFKSGDLGMIDADGFLHITGRKKDLIIVAGEKAVPREIEEALMKHAAVAEAAVLGRKDPSRGEVVVAFVVLKEGQQATPEQLKEACRDEGLASFKVPRDIHFVKELPHSPTGKVLKRVLAAQLKAD
jgi:long-chain acyl-CoA synthetase